MVGNRKSDEVKMKSISGSAVIAASRPASATCEFHLVLISTGFSKMSGCLLMTFMKPSRRFTAFGSARSPTRISGCSFLPVPSNLPIAFAAIASTAWRATASLSATTMMPLLMSEGGRLKVAIGTSASCARATSVVSEVAVVGGQDDAVGALGDAVLDLLELPVGILAAVELDDFDAVVLQRRHDRLVAGDPEARREILERVADFLALCGGRSRCRECGQAGHRSCGAIQMKFIVIELPSRCRARRASLAGRFRSGTARLVLRIRPRYPIETDCANIL